VKSTWDLGSRVWLVGSWGAGEGALRRQESERRWMVKKKKTYRC